VPDSKISPEPPAVDCCGPACDSHGQFWASAEALWWWVRGVNLPPLVTTSPPGTPVSQAGALGSQTVFGGSDVNNDTRYGGRFELGYWFDKERTFGLEGSFFILQGVGKSFFGNSNGDPILSRPYLDVTTNSPAAELVAFPGVVGGTVLGTANSGSLLGADALFRANICCGCCYRLDAIAGYRFLSFNDSVGVTENLIASSVLIGPGTNFVVNDSFRANNDFNAFEVGLTGEARRGRWVITGLADLAIGRNDETVQINGSTTITVPGAAPVTYPGGLLALTSNIGTYHQSEWNVVPELGVRLGYQLNRHVMGYVGYTFLYWPEVARAGNQIDLNVNPNLIPPIVGAPNGPLSPTFTFHESSLWAQGVDLGVEFRF
jgi:hypothetical protein